MVLKKLGSLVGLTDHEETEPPVMTLQESIEAAKKDWQDAKKMFEEATNRDNIDALIHKINASERQYIYLLKLARCESIRAFPEIL